MARLVNPYQRSKTGSFDVPKGLLARQNRVRRVPRSVEDRALLSAGKPTFLVDRVALLSGYRAVVPTVETYAHQRQRSTVLTVQEDFIS